jgi:hypothetical protein
MKRVLLGLLLSCVCASAQYVFPPGGGVGVGAANPATESAGPVTSLAVDITTLNVTSSTLNTLVVQCWTGTGFSAGHITGTRTKLDCTLNPISTTSVTANFASSSNVLVVVNSNGGAGAAGANGDERGNLAHPSGHDAANGSI